MVDGRVVSIDVVRAPRHSVGFHAYMNEMHGSRSKIPSKKISLGSVAWRDLTPAVKG
jgi:hypothetical protein